MSEFNDSNERAVDILRSACSRQEGVSIEKQSCPEDMAMWAVAKIERLEKEGEAPDPKVARLIAELKRGLCCLTSAAQNALAAFEKEGEG